MKLRLLLSFMLALTLLNGCADEEAETADDCSSGFLSEGCGDLDGAPDNIDNNETDNEDDNETDNEDNNEIEEPACAYPADAAPRPIFGRTLPPMKWNLAITADGQNTLLDLEQVYCDPQFENIETIVFIFSATWCPNCPSYVKGYVQPLLPELQNENAMVVWVKAQNNDFEPATSQTSFASFNRYFAGDNTGVHGYFVGEANNVSEVTWANNALVNAFPSQVIVRKSDMKIIATSSQSEYLLPLLQVARHPEADWTDASNNVLPANIGTPCANDIACDSGTLLPYCFTANDPQSGQPTGWIDGYCSGLTCASDAACGEGNICATVTSDGLTACFKGCAPETATTDCRAGYACSPLGGPGTPNACQPVAE